jgi:hypothetical protein
MAYLLVVRKEPMWYGEGENYTRGLKGRREQKRGVALDGIRARP